MSYRTVLFDVDGVMLGEDTYFNATSQTVYELLHGDAFLGGDEVDQNPSLERIAEIRRSVLGPHDEVLDFLKGRGVNSNWDMVYLLLTHSLLKSLGAAADREWAQELCRRGITFADFPAIRERVDVRPAYESFIADFPHTLQKHQFLQYVNELAKLWVGAETEAFGRTSRLWEETRQVFQSIYLGDGAQRPGFLEREEPIVPGDQLQAMLRFLVEKGVQLGIATGRPEQETLVPLGVLGVLNFIPRDRIATATTVLAAEAEVPSAAPLAKPHPFSYLRALRGAEAHVPALLQEPLPQNLRDVLIVGDSLADLLCAKALGTSFAATLTGHEGERARSMFEEHGADHILHNVLDVAKLF